MVLRVEWSTDSEVNFRISNPFTLVESRERNVNDKVLGASTPLRLRPLAFLEAGAEL